MNYDPRFAAICGDARLPSRKTFHAAQKIPRVGTQFFPGDWDASGLRGLLSSRMAQDQIIVVSNRQPFTHARVNGEVTLVQPASGLVTALEPVVRACHGTWIAHASGDCDRDFVDADWKLHGVEQLQRVRAIRRNRAGSDERELLMCEVDMGSA